MKVFTATLLGLACASLFAQDSLDNRVHFACVSVTPKNFLKCHTTLGNDNLHVVAEDKRYSSGADFARHAKVGDTWWPVGGGKIVLTMAALDIRHDDTGYQLTGQSEIHTTTTTVTADNAFYHSDTGEIEATGNVRVTPAP